VTDPSEVIADSRSLAGAWEAEEPPLFQSLHSNDVYIREAGASQRGKKPLNAKPERCTASEAVTRHCRRHGSLR
jgi:hypothetical protein